MGNTSVATRLNILMICIAVTGFGSVSSAQSSARLPSGATSPSWREPGKCGINSLYVYLKLNKISTSYNDLSETFKSTTKEGCSFEDLLQECRRLLPTAEIRRVNPQDMRLIEPPYIVHMEAPDEGSGGHFITVYWNETWGCYYIDGTSGLSNTIGWEDLESKASGYTLAVESSFIGKGGGNVLVKYIAIASLVLLGSLLFVYLIIVIAMRHNSVKKNSAN